MAADLHFAEQTFTLHLFLQCAESLIDVVIAYDDLYDGNHLFSNFMCMTSKDMLAPSFVEPWMRVDS